MTKPLTFRRFFFVIGIFLVFQLCVMLLMPLQTKEMSADNLAFPSIISSIQPIEYSNDSASPVAFRWSLTNNTLRLFGRTMPVAQLLSFHMHHGRSAESSVELELIQSEKTHALILPSGWRHVKILIIDGERSGVYRDIDWNINAEPIVGDPRELGVAVKAIKLTDTTLNPLFSASMLRFLYIGLLWLWVVIICYWRRWPLWSALFVPGVVLTTLWYVPLMVEMYIPSDWYVLLSGYGLFAITILLTVTIPRMVTFARAYIFPRSVAIPHIITIPSSNTIPRTITIPRMITFSQLRAWQEQWWYRLTFFALCFLILVSSNVFFTQKSVELDALAWISTVALVSVVLVLILPRWAHLYLVFAVLLYLSVGAGLFETAFVGLWVASSWSLGVLILERVQSIEHRSRISTTAAVTIGATVWLAIWGVMLHFAVNYQTLHIILCLLPCLYMANRFSLIRKEVHAGVRAAQIWLHSIPFWAWVGGVGIISWVLRWVSFPTVGPDEHATHLRMWTEFLTQHRYSFDFTSQIWSAAPFSVNLLHAGLSLMGGSDARAAMNLGLTILLLLLMMGIFRTLKLPAWTQWLLMVLMVSTPMLGTLLLTLHVELMLAVVVLAGMRLVIDAQGGYRGQHVMGVLACAALCVSIKLPGAVLGVTLLAAFAVHWWTQREATTPTYQLFRLPAIVLLIPLIFVAFHSYAAAWVLTGNPVFPLLNGIFRSSYFDPVNFSTDTWEQGFTLAAYVNAFFNTSAFCECGKYTAGWQYLILLPLAMFALLRSGTPIGFRILLIPILGFGLIMFYTTTYWRYLFPVMPLAVVLIGSLFSQAKTVMRKIALVLSLGCIAANLLFFADVSGRLRYPAGMAFSREGRDEYTRMYAPTVFLTERLNAMAPGSRVLYPRKRALGATLHGTPIYNNWYQPFRQKELLAVKDIDGLRRFIVKEKIDFAILDGDVFRDSLTVLLREYTSQYGYVESNENGFYLVRISDTPVQYRKVFGLHPADGEESGNKDLQILASDQIVITTEKDRILADMPTLRARQARYTVEYRCPSEVGFFVAQIEWDIGAEYRRLLPCGQSNATFTEATPIPIGATNGTILISSKYTSSIEVKNITVEVN